MKKFSPNKTQRRSSFCVRSTSNKLTNQKSLTLTNKKEVQLRSFPYGASPHRSEQKMKMVPEFWGCIVPSHIQQIQRKRLKQIVHGQQEDKTRKITPQKPSVQTAEVSQILLTHYLKRKYYRCPKRNTVNTQPEERNTPLRSENMQKNKRVRSTMFSEPAEQDAIEKYFESEKKDLKDRQEYESERKINKLNEMIKWRSRMIGSIQDGLQMIRISQGYQE